MDGVKSDMIHMDSNQVRLLVSHSLILSFSYFLIHPHFLIHSPSFSHLHSLTNLHSFSDFTRIFSFTLICSFSFAPIPILRAKKHSSCFFVFKIKNIAFSVTTGGPFPGIFLVRKIPERHGKQARVRRRHRRNSRVEQATFRCGNCLLSFGGGRPCAGEFGCAHCTFWQGSARNH